MATVFPAAEMDTSDVTAEARRSPPVTREMLYANVTDRDLTSVIVVSIRTRSSYRADA